jgi:hypothetical protein
VNDSIELGRRRGERNRRNLFVTKAGRTLRDGTVPVCNTQLFKAQKAATECLRLNDKGLGCPT